MRALLLHANQFKTATVKESNRPQNIVPEEKGQPAKEMKNCLVAFFTVEEGDTQKQLDELYQEILKTAEEIKTKNILISPFVHLSNKIADSVLAKKLYLDLMKKFTNTDFVVESSQFGYHKSLLLDVKGHPGSFRYREFY